MTGSVQCLGRYLLLKCLGRGGFATVHLAWDPDAEETVAVKVLHPQYAAVPELVERFRREAETLRSLPRSPHLVELKGFEHLDGQYAIVMEYVEGEDLDRVLKKRGKLPLDEALEIAAQVAEGLAVAHDAGVIHRDVKPKNLRITPAGLVKVMDFGIAKAVEDSGLTGTGQVIGTAAYIAPERWLGRPADARTDVYSQGLVLYEMLAGAPPFTGDTPAVMHKHLLESPQPIDRGMQIPTGVERLVKKALAKEPDKRHATAGELLRDLRNLRPPAPAPAPAVSGAPAAGSDDTMTHTRGPAEQMPDRGRRRAVPAVLVMALVTLALVASYGAGRELAARAADDRWQVSMTALALSATPTLTPMPTRPPMTPVPTIAPAPTRPPATPVPTDTPVPTVSPAPTRPPATPVPSDTPAAVPTFWLEVRPGLSNVQVRSGPATLYGSLGEVNAGDRLTVIGKHPSTNWLKVCCVGPNKDVEGWLLAQEDWVRVSVPLDQLPVATFP